MLEAAIWYDQIFNKLTDEITASKCNIQIVRESKQWTSVAFPGCLHLCVNSHGPVVQSVVSLTSSLRVILLTVLADSTYNILIFLLKKCE